MTPTADEAFAGLMARASRDEGVLGLVVGGGRGKGQATQASDFDVYLVVDVDATAARYPTDPPHVEIDGR